MKNNLQEILKKDSNEVLKALGFSGMSEEEKKQAMDSLEDHFSQIIVRTLVENLDEAQLEEFRTGYEEQKTDMEELVTRLSAQVPGMLEKIEIAVKQEFMTLASAKRVIDRP